jgi:hypothetical protein
MQAIRVTRTLDSETIYLPQLRPLLGQQVEIIVLSAEKSVPGSVSEKVTTNPLAGSVIHYENPFDPAVPASEWEANQ